MATTDPLTGATIYAQTDAALGGQQLGDVVTDLRSYTIPRYTTTSARDTAYAAWVSSGGAMTDGLACAVGGILQLYRSGKWWGLAQGSPVYGSDLDANPVSPLVVTADPNGLGSLSGLARNMVVVNNVVGTWFTLPAGYRPATPQIGMCYIEGGGIVAYQINTDGSVVGLYFVTGAYPIPTPRYWSFNHTFKVA